MAETHPTQWLVSVPDPKPTPACRVSYRIWRGEQDGSRFIVLCETHACLLGGVGGMSLRKILNLHTSQIASDAIWDKISEHFDDTCLR